MADVYNRFLPTDILQSSVHTEPLVDVASGSNGWKSNMNYASASLSLYGGVRARADVKSEDFAASGIAIYPLDPLDTHSIDKVIFVSGSYPATGSIRFPKVRAGTDAPNSTQVTENDWYQEHWGPIELLYSYHSRLRPSFFTGSYDYYSLYLSQNDHYHAASVLFSGSTLTTVTSSLTLEARVKPVRITSSLQDFTVISQRERFKLYVTGTNGTLTFSDFQGTIITSSLALTSGEWQRLAAVVGDGSASLYVGSEVVVKAPYTGSITPYTGSLSVTSSFLSVGSEWVLSGSDAANVYSDNGFRGFVYETRVWSVVRSAAQLSASAAQPLMGTASSSAGLVHYARFNDGPLSTAHGYTMGSGAFDYSPTAIHGTFYNVRTVLPVGPIWQPNDDVTFVTPATKILPSANFFRVLHVPSMFYGRQFVTGSVRLTCNAYSGQGIVRTLVDDGRGGLYLSGSLTRDISGEEYPGNTWRKVGNVFYGEGLVVITDPSLLDFGELGLDLDPAKVDDFQATFKGDNRVYVKTFNCHMPAGQFNASNNPTFTVKNDQGTPDPSDDRLEFVDVDQTVWITGVGIYNEERKLVAIAKFAQPIRKRAQDRENLRVRMDF